ncbi:LamB/YcsF family protein [Ferdinandcohnia quinoae]|uniref:5-oxoprolinase subunit A n=1 Tax=Fredinandcohnia quinoae TaxID=2918902 RepID=A0AAW5E5N5_9BACI|nr:5-oxoprolinase subunit PxpA [Fredinandcohnia sp. SECRCQ15]MCH1626164.1 LamB/YcsF family protein [Fredinandcohnia sp. SECRCQ15]
MKTIDLNCDLGESFGAYKIGNDKQVLQYITSANIACGFHAGDPHVMQKTVKIAKDYRVAVGAHPGFQDLVGFGRRNMTVSPSDVYDLVLYQLGALSAFCRANDVLLHHVKPHGALYNIAAIDSTIAEAIANATRSFDSTLLYYGLAGSKMIEAGDKAGLRTVSEVFADRTYQLDGTLTPRTEKNSVIHDPEKATHQVLQMLTNGTVQTVCGATIPIKAESICVHGDNEQAILFVKALREMLVKEGFHIKASRG